MEALDVRQKYYSFSQAAKHLGASKNTVIKHIAKKEFPVRFVGSKRVLTLEEVESLVKTQEPDQPGKTVKLFE